MGNLLDTAGQCVAGKGQFSSIHEEYGNEEERNAVAQHLEQRQRMYEDAMDLLNKINESKKKIEKDIDVETEIANKFYEKAKEATRKKNRGEAKRALIDRKLCTLHIAKVNQVYVQVATYAYKMKEIRYLKDTVSLGEELTKWAQNEQFHKFIESEQFELHSEEMERMAQCVSEGFVMLNGINTSLSSESDTAFTDNDEELEKELKELEKEVSRTPTASSGGYSSHNNYNDNTYTPLKTANVFPLVPTEHKLDMPTKEIPSKWARDDGKEIPHRKPMEAVAYPSV